MWLIGVCGRKGSGKDAVGTILTREYGFVRIALADPIKQLAHLLFGFSLNTLFGPSAEREMPLGAAVTGAWWGTVYGQLARGVVDAELVRLFGVAALPRASAQLLYLCQVVFEPLGPDLNARVVLQQMGTEYGRSLDPDVWVRAARKAASRLGPGTRYHPLYGVVSGQPRIGETGPRGVVVTDVRYENEVQCIRAHEGPWGVWTINAQERLPPPPAQEHTSEPPYGLQASWATRILPNNGTLEALTLHVHAYATELGIQKVAQLDEQGA